MSGRKTNLSFVITEENLMISMHGPPKNSTGEFNPSTCSGLLATGAKLVRRGKNAMNLFNVNSNLSSAAGA